MDGQATPSKPLRTPKPTKPRYARPTNSTFLCKELGAAVGLLLASRMGEPVYKRLWWQVADGPLRCDQPDGPLLWTTVFPDKPAMAWTCTSSGLPAGPIDLQGLPW
jgi:hypothetical protein